MAFNGIIPANKSIPAPYGLFSVADVTRHGSGDEHWINAFDVVSESCTFDASILDVCGGTPLPVMLHDDPRFRTVRPFGIRADDECLSVGWSVDDRRARVTRQLELVTPKAVEQELWNGTYSRSLTPDGSDYLSNSATTTLIVSDAGGIGPLLALALLEQALASCGAGIQGVIHMPRSLAPLLGNQVVARASDDQLQTLNGNLVVFGTGYDGRGPGATTPPSPMTPWIYATGPVYVHLGPTELITPGPREATNIGTNVMNYVAVRPAAAYWDGCCHFGVKVDLTKTPANGATPLPIVLDNDGIT